MAGPLTGVRVLDLSRVLAGPYTSMVLADLGAEVVKVEEPGVGDESRRIGPFQNGVSTYFFSINRGKKGLTLNLKAEAGKRLFLDLVRQADILVENYRPGVMKRLGLDYPALRAVNPRLVYAACSGFGHTGPYSPRGAYDMIVQGMGGLMSITGEPGRPPVRVGTSIGDIAAALFTAIGILAALGHARATGEGQFVDVAMLDCQVAILENAIMRYLVTGRGPGAAGRTPPLHRPLRGVPGRGRARDPGRGHQHLGPLLRGHRSPRPHRAPALCHQRAPRRARGRAACDPRARSSDRSGSRPG